MMTTTDLNKYIGMRCNLRVLTVFKTSAVDIDRLKKPTTFIIVNHYKGKMVITDRMGSNHMWLVKLSSLKDLY